MGLWGWGGNPVSVWDSNSATKIKLRVAELAMSGYCSRRGQVHFTVRKSLPVCPAHREAGWSGARLWYWAQATFLRETELKPAV